ncbi:MAG: formyl transferase [Methylobacterium sp.]|uniref:glucosamine inositolphosphorylceramide transferase family protein n=1 Tax=Methylobacterium sp. TaxID=409 RepID=UPI0025D75BF0|nr:formyl transferase [Methylobacterium sp.]MBX9934340.1 formyl transferase [Methylobacterium sp.]
MRLRLRLDGRSPRRWHLALIARLAGLPGVGLEIDASPGPGGLPDNSHLLFRLEAMLGRLPVDGPSAFIAPESLRVYAPKSNAEPDLVLDLCGDVSDKTGPRVWTLLFDGRPGEEALLASILDGRMPVSTLREDGRVIASARLGTESIGSTIVSFEDGVTRATMFVAAAVSERRPRLEAGEEQPDPPAIPDLSLPFLGVKATKMLVWGILRRIYHLCYRAPHWRVGWRRLDGPDLIDLRAHPPSGWHDLPDDGHRFYADPFALDHRGRTILFVEDYEHARGKAIISAVEFDGTGPVGTPIPVLDEPYHLSYPFVFERDGAIWMIPEGSANRTVGLYRSTAFPGGWVKEATLLSGLTAGDVTLIERDGRWWMFATVRDFAADHDGGPVRGSYSDALHLWSAPDFRGPWVPHAQNPVLIDIASARPAGHIVERGGALIRPVQDGRRGYGEALSLARITRLDDDGFGQTVETTLRAGPGWPGKRLHTLNRSANYEFIDGSGRAPRFR